jgi:hypothetical protein
VVLGTAMVASSMMAASSRSRREAGTCQQAGVAAMPRPVGAGGLWAFALGPGRRRGRRLTSGAPSPAGKAQSGGAVSPPSWVRGSCGC